MIRVGEEIVTQLEKAGIGVIHDKEIYDREDHEFFAEERETIRHNWYTLTIVDTEQIEHVNLDNPVRLDFKECNISFCNIITGMERDC